MKPTRFLGIAAIALAAVAALGGCKKEPFQKLDETVNEINTQIEDGKTPFANDIFTVSSLDYDEITNTVKSNVPYSENTGNGASANIVLMVVSRYAPNLDAAIQEAEANVMVCTTDSAGKPVETLFETTAANPQ